MSVCLSGSRPVASQMGVCEEDYYCKPALPTYTLFQRPTFTRPTFHAIQSPLTTPSCTLLKNTWHFIENTRDKNHIY